MSEYNHQVAIFQWASLMESRYPELRLLNASLNGVRLSIGNAVKIKRSGVKKGYPDASLPVKRGEFSGLYIELKVDKNRPSKEQKEWLEQLRLQGFICAVVWGSDNSIKLIQDYLDGKIKNNDEVLYIK